jgi:hypothetical protein
MLYCFRDYIEIPLVRLWLYRGGVFHADRQDAKLILNKTLTMEGEF